MQQQDSAARHDEPHMLFHLKLVGKIALLVGLAACVGLVLTLMSASAESGASYAEIIRSYNLTRQHLGPALLVAALFIAAFAAVITWLISLYSSFRVAGPLFRFSRNLELEIRQGPTAPVPIRKNDSLQQEHAQLKRGIDSLQSHYGAIRQAMDQAAAALDSGDKDKWPEVLAAIARLKELDSRVRL